MKKIFIVWLCLLTIQTATYAGNDKPIVVTQLPQQAQLFIKEHFTNNKIALAKVDDNWLDRTYNVIFTNGDKLEFDRQGKWTEVNCKYNSVPHQIIPAMINKYLSETYPEAKVLKLEQSKRGGYELKLSNKWELKFDLNFNLLEIDD